MYPGGTPRPTCHSSGVTGQHGVHARCRPSMALLSGPRVGSVKATGRDASGLVWIDAGAPFGKIFPNPDLSSVWQRVRCSDQDSYPPAWKITGEEEGQRLGMWSSRGVNRGCSGSPRIKSHEREDRVMMAKKDAAPDECRRRVSL